MPDRAVYRARREAGMCGQCGIVPPAPGKAQCDPCDQRMLRRRQELVRTGVCIDCGRVDAARDTVRCDPCGERHVAASMERYRAREARGVCTRCGRRPPAEIGPGTGTETGWDPRRAAKGQRPKTCLPCLERERESRARRREFRLARPERVAEWRAAERDRKKRLRARRRAAPEKKSAQGA